MNSGNARKIYLRALREEQQTGIARGVRPETTLEEARTELAQALARIGKSILMDKYGPHVVVISEPLITELLKKFESNLARTTGDLSILIHEILDRVFPSLLQKKSNGR
jgi:hypothetical protein